MSARQFLKRVLPACVFLAVTVTIPGGPLLPRLARGTESLQTRRWRKADSNSRSHPTGQCQNRNDTRPLRRSAVSALAGTKIPKRQSEQRRAGRGGVPGEAASSRSESQMLRDPDLFSHVFNVDMPSLASSYARPPVTQ